MSCLVVDYAVHDFGDLTFKHLEKDEHFMHVPFPRTVGRANQLLSGAVSGAVGAGHTCIMLGGDHRYTILFLYLKVLKFFFYKAFYLGI